MNTPWFWPLLTAIVILTVSVLALKLATPRFQRWTNDLNPTDRRARRTWTIASCSLLIAQAIGWLGFFICAIFMVQTTGGRGEAFSKTITASFAVLTLVAVAGLWIARRVENYAAGFTVGPASAVGLSIVLGLVPNMLMLSLVETLTEPGSTTREHWNLGCLWLGGAFFGYILSVGIRHARNIHKTKSHLPHEHILREDPQVSLL